MVGPRNLKVGLLLASVFLLGAAAGGFGVYAWSERQYADELFLGPGLRHEQRMLRGLARRLNLNTDQVQRIRAVMEGHRAERLRLVNEMDETCSAPMRNHKSAMDASIRAILTPEQEVEFLQILDEQTRRFGHGHGSRPGGPKGGSMRGGTSAAVPDAGRARPSLDP